MLFSGCIGMGLQLRSQVGLQHDSFPGRPTRDRFWQQVTGLSSLFEIAFDRGNGNGEGLGDLRLAVSVIDCPQHALP
jgi:hypothetical protein